MVVDDIMYTQNDRNAKIRSIRTAKSTVSNYSIGLEFEKVQNYILRSNEILSLFSLIDYLTIHLKQYTHAVLFPLDNKVNDF